MAGDATTIRTIDQEILEIIEGVWLARLKVSGEKGGPFSGKLILPER